MRTSPTRAARTRLGPPFTAPEGQGATFVELFFDLVFVFAITEVTARTLEHLNWGGAAQSALIFWMIWWAWTQFTWALNPADTEHGLVRVGTLVATGVAFLLAASVRGAFEDGNGGLWFAGAYVAVRGMGLALYVLVTSERDQQLAAVRLFAVASLGGLFVAILGGFVEGDLRGWVWLAAVLLDVTAAAIAGKQEGWGLHAAHFAERHGLFVIIALGESLIVVGATLASAERTSELVAVGIGAVAVTCLLWWTYFGWLKDDLEDALEHEPVARTGLLGRDAYSLLHFPLVGGVMGIAVGFEEMALHPGDHLRPEGLIALMAGLALFVGGAAASWLRARRRLLWPRLLVLGALMVALAVASEAKPAAVLTIVACGLVAIVVLELWQDPSGAAVEVPGTS